MARVVLTLMQSGRVQSCVRPVDAVLMTAGPNAIRGSGPNHKRALLKRPDPNGFSRPPVGATGEWLPNGSATCLALMCRNSNKPSQRILPIPWTTVRDPPYLDPPYLIFAETQRKLPPGLRPPRFSYLAPPPTSAILDRRLAAISLRVRSTATRLVGARSEPQRGQAVITCTSDITCSTPPASAVARLFTSLPVLADSLPSPSANIPAAPLGAGPPPQVDGHPVSGAAAGA